MAQKKFEEREFYSSNQPYQLLPFRFLPFEKERMLLVNEVGEYLLLQNNDFNAFVLHQLRPETDVYLDLKGKHFLRDSQSITPLNLLATKYRTKKAHLAGFTKLHIFVVTLRCEHSCLYCQVSRVTPDRARYDMSSESALRALDLVFRCPAEAIKIEFQGGEPLLNFDRIAEIIEIGESRAVQTGKSLQFVVASNLALITDSILEYFCLHNVLLSTSLDGPEFLHNANRPRPGNNSYSVTINNIAKAREVLGADKVSALMTSTRLSLNYPHEIVDEYISCGFSGIFLRPLSPYGFALRTVRSLGYRIEEFLDFYKTALDYILEINRRGRTFVEQYAQIVLTKIFTSFSTGYVDLQSPTGAGIGAVVYNYDGDVYASDEARMLAENGDTTFRLGNVHRDSYQEIFGSALLRSIVRSSCIESLPGCADCAFQPYCGTDPVFNYATQQDIVGHRPTNDFHKKNYFIIKHLIRLYESDSVIRRIFWAWIMNRDVAEVSEGLQ